MSAGIKLNEHLYWIGVNDRQTDFFEELWPIPNGIAYNSFLVLDDKVALIDAVKDISLDRYLKKIRKLVSRDRGIDYLIIKHIEPDHSGAVKILRELFPRMQIVGNRKTLELLAAFHGISENFLTVDDGSFLHLGGCRLQFHITPMVHWPETMMTFEQRHQVLFSGDVFGGFTALDDGIFDDRIRDLGPYEYEMLRYFTNVIGKYSVMVQKALAKIAGLDIRMLAPTHGLIWRNWPRHAVGLYDRWSRYEAEDGVVIVYASMYGSTENMMEAIAHSLGSETTGALRIHNLARVHPSYILTDIWRYRGVILGSPTYNTGLFPLMDHLIRLLENKMLRHRVAGVFGSCGWSGGALQELGDFIRRMKWELVEPAVEVKGAPREEDLKRCALLGANMLKQLRTGIPRGGEQGDSL